MLQQEEDRQRNAGELTSEKETAVAYAAKGGNLSRRDIIRDLVTKGGYHNNQGSNQGSNQGEVKTQGPLLLLWEARSL